MLKKNKSARSHSKLPSQDELRSSIISQTEKFLKLGGVIQSIPNGVSGYSEKPSNKKIKIDRKRV